MVSLSICHLNGQEGFSLSSISGPDLADRPGCRRHPRRGQRHRRSRRQKRSASAPPVTPYGYSRPVVGGPVGAELSTPGSAITHDKPLLARLSTLVPPTRRPQFRPPSPPMCYPFRFAAYQPILPSLPGASIGEIRFRFSLLQTCPSSLSCHLVCWR